jgi:hypothetical protein
MNQGTTSPLSIILRASIHSGLVAKVLHGPCFTEAHGDATLWSASIGTSDIAYLSEQLMQHTATIS